MFHSIHHLTNPPMASFRLFDWDAGSKNLPSVDRLDPIMTINGVSVAPTFRYKGGDANAVDWPAWGYGDTLTAAGSGGSFNRGSPLLGSNDDSVNPNGTRYYTGSTCDLETNDFVVEQVICGTLTASKYILRARGAGAGWQIYTPAVLNAIYLKDAAANTAVIYGYSTAPVQPTWFHIIYFFDRSGSGVAYANGAVQSAVNISAVGSLSGGSTFEMVACLGGDIYDAPLAYMALWQYPAWLDTHLQATVAQTRFYKMCGLYPQHAKGTILPVSATRTSAANIRKQEGSTKKLYTVGVNWPRVCAEKDAGGTTRYLHRNVGVAVNYALQSEDFSTTWAELNGADGIATNDIEAPDKKITADALIADNTDTIHGYSQTYLLTANTWSLSCWFKAGSKTWGYLDNTTVANCWAYFDLDNAVVGTKGAGCIGSLIEDWGDGWIRCGMSFTGTVADHTFRVCAANADSDNDFAGDGAAKSVYLWGAMLTRAATAWDGKALPEYARSTTGTGVTQSDTIYFKGDDGNVMPGLFGSMRYTGLFPVVAIGNPLAYPLMTTLVDGAGTNDKIYLYYDAGTPGCAAYSSAGAGNTGNVVHNVSRLNNTLFSSAVTWTTNAFSLYVNQALAGTDSSMTVPDDLSRIYIGNWSTSLSNIWMAHYRIYPRIILPQHM